MQFKDKCEFCTKSQCVGKNNEGKLQFGCNNSFCIFDPIVDNDYRTQLKAEYNKNYK